MLGHGGDGEFHVRGPVGEVGAGPAKQPMKAGGQEEQDEGRRSGGPTYSTTGHDGISELYSHRCNPSELSGKIVTRVILPSRIPASRAELRESDYIPVSTLFSLFAQFSLADW